MNLCFVINHNYVEQLMVTLYSCYINNKDENIVAYVIQKDLTISDKNRLTNFFMQFNIKINFFDVNDDLFIKIFGTSFFYRMDRILNWSNSSGLQLTNSLTAIGSAGSLGHGFNHTPIYFPEMQTDFIFAVFASNFGFIGVLCFLVSLLSDDSSNVAYS